LQVEVSVPSQTLPHVVSAPAPPHALLEPCGAPTAGEHVPTFPLTSHAAH
jgi:hypothetical protein